MTLAFDVYGTLIDPQAIRLQLDDLVGEAAAGLATRWREKQLEYTFRRTAMSAYVDFSQVTAHALDHSCASLGLQLEESARQTLLESYRRLAAFDDAAPALASLQTTGQPMHAFSNGLPDDLDSLLQHAGLHRYLGTSISVHDVGSFKPHPLVYAHFNEVAGCQAQHTWLVSSNAFDVIGALACGWKAVWVQRSSDVVFDPWGIEPTAVIDSLAELPAIVRAGGRQG